MCTLSTHTQMLAVIVKRHKERHNKLKYEEYPY